MKHDVCSAEFALAQFTDDLEDAVFELLHTAGGRVPANDYVERLIADALVQSRILAVKPQWIEINVTVQV